MKKQQEQKMDRLTTIIYALSNNTKFLKKHTNKTKK